MLYYYLLKNVVNQMTELFQLKSNQAKEKKKVFAFKRVELSHLLAAATLGNQNHHGIKRF